jgi:hypothetical protein
MKEIKNLSINMLQEPYSEEEEREEKEKRWDGAVEVL